MVNPSRTDPIPTAAPSELSERLSAQALAVCRRYLSNGRRQGNYWVVGDARNTPGRSMYVRLFPDGPGRKAGRWTDAATAEFGDLLDIIQRTIPSGTFVEALAEAEAFLGNTPTFQPARSRTDRPRPSNRTDQAHRLFSQGGVIEGTLGDAYLAGRGIDPRVAAGLRFHPKCYSRPDTLDARASWPALIAPVTDALGCLKGIHRIYLDPHGSTDANLGKAPLLEPKKSLGRIHGHAVRFGPPAAFVIVAEGIENALSVRTAFPDFTVHAALNAGNLAAYIPLPLTTQLAIALDDDEPGWTGAQRLADRARIAGLSVSMLRPQAEDHNLDLRTLGPHAYRQSLRSQLAV